MSRNAPTNAPTAPPTLAELQELMQRAILDGDTGALLPLIPGNGRTTSDVLLGVYQHAYVARLAGICSNDYPFLAACLGDDAMSALSRAYIAAHPSHTTNARWFSHALPEFLASQASHRDLPHLAELARLERALNDAFDAPDAPVLSLEDLGSVPPQAWGDLVLAAHPSATRLDLASNAHAIWSALKDELPPPVPERLAEPARLLVWRQGMTAMVRPLAAEEAMTWDEARGGAPFGRLCELVAFNAEPDTAALRAAGYLQTWLAAGALTEASVAADPVEAAASCPSSPTP